MLFISEGPPSLPPTASVLVKQAAEQATEPHASKTHLAKDKPNETHTEPKYHRCCPKHSYSWMIFTKRSMQPIKTQAKIRYQSGWIIKICLRRNNRSCA